MDMVCGTCRGRLTPQHGSPSGYCHVDFPTPYHSPVPVPAVPRTRFTVKKIGDCWRIGIDGDQRPIGDWVALREALPKSLRVILRIEYKSWDDALLCVRSAVWVSRNLGGVASLTRGFGS